MLEAVPPPADPPHEYPAVSSHEDPAASSNTKMRQFETVRRSGNGQSFDTSVAEVTRATGILQDLFAQRTKAQTSAAQPQEAPTLSRDVGGEHREVSETRQRVTRAHFGRLLLSDLGQARTRSGDPSMSVYVASLMRTIRTLRDLAPIDPFTDVAVALYDALAFRNSWQRYSATEYGKAEEVLSKLLSRRRTTFESAEKAILRLEDAGFQTTPVLDEP